MKIKDSDVGHLAPPPKDKDDQFAPPAKKSGTTTTTVSPVTTTLTGGSLFTAAPATSTAAPTATVPVAPTDDSTFSNIVDTVAAGNPVQDSSFVAPTPATSPVALLPVGAPLTDALELAELKLADAHDACVDQGWSLDSQVSYLRATQDAILTYEAVNPFDARLIALHQQESDLTRQVKTLADQGVQAAAGDCTMNDWSLKSQLGYLQAVRSAERAYSVAAPNDPKLENLQQLESGLTHDVKELADSNVDSAYQHCVESNWSVDSQTDYLKAAQWAAMAYAVAAPKDARLETLKALVTDLTGDVKDAADNALEAAYARCTDSDWMLDAQCEYLEATRSAVRAYETASPNDPRLTDLRQLDSDLSDEVEQLTGVEGGLARAEAAFDPAAGWDAFQPSVTWYEAANLASSVWSTVKFQSATRLSQLSELSTNVWGTVSGIANEGVTTTAQALMAQNFSIEMQLQLFREISWPVLSFMQSSMMTSQLNPMRQETDRTEEDLRRSRLASKREWSRLAELDPMANKPLADPPVHEEPSSNWPAVLKNLLRVLNKHRKLHPVPV